MVCQLRNLIYYLNAFYAILYPKGMTIDETNEFLSVISTITMGESLQYNSPNFQKGKTYGKSLVPVRIYQTFKVTIFEVTIRRLTFLRQFWSVKM